jgi:NAD(P)-dependent dehydrogenase (short-subunit alcohol dehydrogenase family)
VRKKPQNIVIIGCSGAISIAFAKRLSDKYENANIHVFCRQEPQKLLPGVSYGVINYEDESSIEKSALKASSNGPIDLVIVATGFLHGNSIMPERSLKEVSLEKFQYLFRINAINPALIAKHFLPKLNKESFSFFAALSARIGSISDNRLGGWYAYRASKAALNMIIKNAAIELERTNKNAVIVGLHPGTVDSDLSKPFQGSVPKDKLFTADYSTERLLEVLEDLTPQQSGKCFAWDGKEILP